jgi:hypothetical protein
MAAPVPTTGVETEADAQIGTQNNDVIRSMRQFRIDGPRNQISCTARE